MKVVDILFLLLSLADLYQDAIAVDSPIVNIPGLGRVIGDVGKSNILKRTFYKYKGIRYALSPSGKRRFQPPEPAGGWRGILNAKSFGRICPQIGLFPEEKGRIDFEDLDALAAQDFNVTGELPPETERQGAGTTVDIEDCLFIHIYTPKALRTAKLPVMVFIHGGSFSAGSALVYNAEKFMDHDVVLVVPHYRLGPLGFSSMQNDDIPGNAGLLDQVLALEWVRDHIKYFGGDPNLVTIFGESAGAASVSYHMLSPLSQGLFHRVIGQSGSALADWALDEDPVYHAINIAKLLNCKGTGADGRAVDAAKVTKCLQTADAMKLTLAYQTYWLQQIKLGLQGFGGSSPVVQKAGKKKFIKKRPIEVFESGDYVDVPIMFGATRDEGTFVLSIFYMGYMVPNGLQNDVEHLIQKLPHNALKFIYGRDPHYWEVDAMSNTYLKRDIPGNFTELIPGLTDFFGVGFLKGPSYRNVQLHSKKNKSFFYAFNYNGSTTVWDVVSVPGTPFDGGVCHAIDLLYLFNIPQHSLNHKDTKVSRKMVSLWTNFAKYGKPNPKRNRVKGVPKWRPYDSKRKFYMRFDKKFKELKNFKKEYTINEDEANRIT